MNLTKEVSDFYNKNYKILKIKISDTHIETLPIFMDWNAHIPHSYLPIHAISSLSQYQINSSKLEKQFENLYRSEKSQRNLKRKEQICF